MAPYLHDEPSVSIIINNYNYGRYVAEAIRSAQGQSCRPKDVIVVDDGSTDESRDVISSFGNAIKAIFKANEGQPSALNAGFAKIQTEIVIFLDADDLLLPKACELVTQAFKSNPETSKIQYRMQVIDADGRPTGQLKPDPRLRVPCGDIRRRELTFPFDIPWLPTSGNAFSAKVLRKIMPVPGSYGRAGADWYLAHLAPLYGPVHFIDEIAACYRVHGSNYYERVGTQIDTDHIRESIHYMSQTNVFLEEHGARLGLTQHAGDILSVSDIANRMIYLKLNPNHDPTSGDSITRLFSLGIKAAYRRFDVSFARRTVFAAWFAAMRMAPAFMTEWLATRFLYAGTRKSMGRLLDRL